MVIYDWTTRDGEPKSTPYNFSIQPRVNIFNYFLFDFFQMEEYMRANFGTQLDLPSCREESTIFEYYVNDTGEWDHWDSKVFKKCCFFI